jgi:hypothetical protein
MAGKPGKGVQQKIELALYNLMKDPGETTNLADAEPGVVKRLQALAEKAREELGDSATKRTGKGVRQPGRIKE